MKKYKCAEMRNNVKNHSLIPLSVINCKKLCGRLFFNFAIHNLVKFWYDSLDLNKEIEKYRNR